MAKDKTYEHVEQNHRQLDKISQYEAHFLKIMEEYAAIPYANLNAEIAPQNMTLILMDI